MEYLRQLDILDPNMIVFPVSLIGCGGIGSPTALVLAKMGCENLTLIDGDSVEAHNLPSQIFRKTDIGKKKVDACKETVLEFTDCNINTVPEFFNKQSLYGVVISGVDTMEARQKIWSRVRYNVEVPLYIDGRIGGEIVQIYTIRPSQLEDVEFYEKWLFPDEEVAELPCTAKAIVYIGFTIGALIASQLKKWLKNEPCYKRISFDLKTMTIVMQ